MYPSTEDPNTDSAETYQNMPNMSMMFTMYNTTFGNGAFAIQPPSPGEVGRGFPTVPYLSLAALFYQQQASNPSLAPVNIKSGNNVGEQVVQGAYTNTDAAGTSRVLSGFQPGGASSILNTANTQAAL
jgi:hypothetical protein